MLARVGEAEKAGLVLTLAPPSTLMSITMLKLELERLSGPGAGSGKLIGVIGSLLDSISGTGTSGGADTLLDAGEVLTLLLSSLLSMRLSNMRSSE